MTKKIDGTILAYLAGGQSIAKKTPLRAIKLINKGRKLAMRKTVRLPRPIKMQFCKKCNSPLIFGHNCKVRVRNKTMIFHCQVCKNMQKFGSTKNSSK